MIEEKKKHKKSKKPISAMAQVHNKVNSAIMGAITCGGMFEEGAEPEANEYRIGTDGEYAHVYEENGMLNEIKVVDKYNLEKSKGKIDMPFEEYENLCNLDPSTKNGIAGKYVNWILIRRNEITPENIGNLRVALEQYYDAVKRNILKSLGVEGDIMKYKHINDFISAMSFSDGNSGLSEKELNNRAKLEGQFEILATSKNFEIIHPKTFEAERYFGGGTSWCTVANDYYYNHYTKSGYLYITYPKDGDKRKKLQFHFKSDSFATYDDKVDSEISRCILRCVRDNYLSEDEDLEVLDLWLNSGINGNYRHELIDLKESNEYQMLTRKMSPEEIRANFDVKEFENIVLILKKGTKSGDYVLRSEVLGGRLDSILKKMMFRDARISDFDLDFIPNGYIVFKRAMSKNFTVVDALNGREIAVMSEMPERITNNFFKLKTWASDCVLLNATERIPMFEMRSIMSSKKQELFAYLRESKYVLLNKETDTLKNIPLNPADFYFLNGSGMFFQEKGKIAEDDIQVIASSEHSDMLYYYDLQKGEIVSGPYEEANPFRGEYALVKKINGKKAFIDRDFNNVQTEFNETAIPIPCGYIVAKGLRSFNIVGENLEPILKNWLPERPVMLGDYIRIKRPDNFCFDLLNPKLNFKNLDQKGLGFEVISPDGFFIYVMTRNKKWYVYDARTFELYLNEPFDKIISRTGNGDILNAIYKGEDISIDLRTKQIVESKKSNKSMLLEATEFSKDDYKKYFRQIGDYMSSHGLNVKPFPKVKLDDEKQDGLFIMTGHYEPDNKLVVLYTDGRHPKDILRTFSHEMIHHHQTLSGKNMSFSGADNVKDNKELEKLEAEAYLKGNIYFRKWTEYFKNNGKEKLNESVDEVSVSDVDLSSFKIQKELNPKFWVDGHLDKRIRMKLLDIADEFVDYLDISWVKPEDIIMAGSLAGYNWNPKYSDIDLHVIIDYNDVDENSEFVESYFAAKAKLWNEEHADIKIFGFPVELYVQDSNNNNLNSAGVYSIDKDEWLTEPNRDDVAKHKANKNLIRHKVSELSTHIDELIKQFKESGNDMHKIEIVHDEAEKLFDKIKNERKEGFESDSNEMNNANIIFKALRRMNYIGKLADLREKTYNIINSLD